MFLKNRSIFPAGLLSLAIAATAFGQTEPAKPESTPAPTPEAAKTPKKDDKKAPPPTQAIDPSKFTAEQVAESAIIVYSGNIMGRDSLNQIRKTSYEKGKMAVIDAGGKSESANYERWIMRGENLNKERVRLDQIYPGTSYSLIYNADKIFGVYQERVFQPRDDATTAFKSQIWHGIDGLLRYKENGATLSLAGREKIMGVEYFLLDVTDAEKRTTRYFVSVKSFRVMFLDYTEAGVTYRRKFYDYRYAQGTLVPYRTVLLAGERPIEEMTIGTITFGQKVDEELFKES